MGWSFFRLTLEDPEHPEGHGSPCAMVRSLSGPCHGSTDLGGSFSGGWTVNLSETTENCTALESPKKPLQSPLPGLWESNQVVERAERAKRAPNPTQEGPRIPSDDLRKGLQALCNASRVLHVTIAGIDGSHQEDLGAAPRRTEPDRGPAPADVCSSDVPS